MAVPQLLSIGDRYEDATGGKYVSNNNPSPQQHDPLGWREQVQETQTVVGAGNPHGRALALSLIYNHHFFGLGYVTGAERR